MKRRSRRPTVGLALSGGSVRGLFYIGFLKVLDEERIPIDYIAGTSIGAVIGAFYCSGMHPRDMEKIALGMKWENFMDFACGYTGLLDGKRIEGFLRKSLGVKRFRDLYVPLVVTAVDVNTGEEVFFDSGDIAEAVRASISIPGVFTPVKIGNRLLVDGGVLDPVPIAALKGKVNKIIAIDLSVPLGNVTSAHAVDKNSSTWKQFKSRFINQEVRNLNNYLRSRRVFPRVLLRLLNPKYLIKFLQGKPLDLPPLFEIALRANQISTNELIRLKIEKNKPDLLIKPVIADARFIEFDKAGYIIKEGEIAARKSLKDIKRLAGLP